MGRGLEVCPCARRWSRWWAGTAIAKRSAFWRVRLRFVMIADIAGAGALYHHIFGHLGAPTFMCGDGHTRRCTYGRWACARCSGLVEKIWHTMGNKVDSSVTNCQFLMALIFAWGIICDNLRPSDHTPRAQKQSCTREKHGFQIKWGSRVLGNMPLVVGRPRSMQAC